MAGGTAHGDMIYGPGRVAATRPGPADVTGFTRHTVRGWHGTDKEGREEEWRGRKYEEKEEQKEERKEERGEGEGGEERRGKGRK